MKYAKISIDVKKLIGFLISAMIKGEDKISFNLNPPKELNDNSPDYSNDSLSLWINESKFN